MVNNKCIIPNCTTGYRKYNTKKKSLFRITENRLKIWSSAIPVKIKINDLICENHFSSDSVLNEWNAPNSNIKVPLNVVKLKKDAIPTLLLNEVHGNSQSFKQEKRKLPLILNHKEAKKQKHIPVHDVTLNNPEASDVINNKTNLLFDNNNDHDNNNLETVEIIETGPGQSSVVKQKEIIKDILMIEKIKLPSKNWSFCTVIANDSEMFVFSEIHFSKYLNITLEGKKMTVCKTIICLFYNNVPVCSDLLEKFRTELIKTEHTDTIQNILNSFALLPVCCSGPHIGQYKNVSTSCATKDHITSTFRHIKCKIIHTDQMYCKPCQSLHDTLRIALNRSLKNNKLVRRKINLTDSKQRKLQFQLRVKERLKRKNKILELKLKQQQEKFESLSEKDILDKLKNSNIPSTQQLLISECMKSGVCLSKHGRRYSPDWILNCLLLNIRNSGVYKYLRENNVLPLPAPSTIRRYLYKIDCKCGIDKQFFESFKKKMSTLDDRKRHGILIFDEMSVRTNIDVNVRNMKLSGVVDLGEENQQTHDSNQLADHGLVFMFASLADKYCQPVAVYGCKGPTKGSVLVKLLLQVLCEIEKSNGRVDGIVCDGASTNRYMWNMLGISGECGKESNKFTHPMDQDRFVYVFSDAPHLIKCVRNRLYSKDLKFHGENIKWAHYRTLFNEDSTIPGKLRVCPKLTNLHIDPTSMLKMRVKLATQVFSNSVHHGLLFYKNRGVRELQNVDGTIKFTKKMNDLFDVLNRRFKLEGIKKNSIDFQTMQDSLKFLNEWQQELNSGKISANEFLTNSTAEGLRVTIISTIELSKYLLENCNFDFVLTNKMNQDPLERFFGILRQAGCDNDHPTFGTFMQLYRMLSVYKLLKPPKAGNCTVLEVEEENTNKITLQDFQNIFHGKSNLSYRKKHINDLKCKLDGFIVKEIEIEEIIDHDYAMPEVVDCIIYYISGFVCRKLLSTTTCSECISGLKKSNNVIAPKESELTNTKSKGYLIHPSCSIFKLFQVAENILNQNWNRINVYEETITEILLNNVVSFPCTTHGKDIISYALHYYILLRLRQYVKSKNKNTIKNNAKQKKISKLQKT